MSETWDVKFVSCNIGALSNAFTPLFKMPTGPGGMTVLDFGITLRAAGTTALNLVDLGTAGTAVEGTIYSKGSAVYVANRRQGGTSVTPYVASGHVIGVEEANVGAANAVTIVDLSFIWGKS